MTTWINPARLYQGHKPTNYDYAFTDVVSADGTQFGDLSFGAFEATAYTFISRNSTAFSLPQKEDYSQSAKYGSATFGSSQYGATTTGIQTSWSQPARN